MPVRVFISSRIDELACERDIAIETIRLLGLEPVYFERNAGISDPVTESLRLVANSDIVIVILWKSYSKIVELEYEEAIKLNKYIIILEKVVKNVEERDEKLKNFLNKIKNKHVYKKFYRASELRQAIIDSIQDIFLKSINILRKLPDNEIYAIVRAKIVNSKELYIYSRTPILLFGPRPYLSEHKYYEEEYGYYLTKEAMNKAIKGEKKFTLVASGDSIINEIYQYNNKDLLKKVIENIKYLKKLQNKTFRFAITPISGVPSYITYLIADDTSIIWIKIENQNYCIHINSKDFSLSLIRIIEKYVEKDYSDKLLKELEAMLNER